MTHIDKAVLVPALEWDLVGELIDAVHMVVAVDRGRTWPDLARAIAALDNAKAG